MRKRLVSLFITITMICAFIPVIANADMSINIGEYVQMGTYYGQPILWRCVDIDENGPLMLSDKILCIKAYDAGGSDTSGSHGRDSNREVWGSNYWADSNMRSWLNSTASAGNVEWLCGNPPVADELYNVYNAYDDEAGFLSNFTESERNAMKPVSQKSLVAYPESDNGIYTTGTEQHEYDYNIEDVVQNYDTAYAEYVTDKMFLMDVKQVNAVYNNGDILGDDYYIGEPTAQCVENSEYQTSSLSEEGKWHYWLRSPDSDDYYHVRCVTSEGEVNGYSALSYVVGVRPAFYLNFSSSVVDGTGEITDPYIIINKKKITASYDSGYISIDAMEDTKINLYVAGYDEKKKLKSCDMQIIFVEEGINRVKIDDVEMGSYVKFLLWDENMNPLCDALTWE